MEKLHDLTQDALREIDSAIERNENWLAINIWQYHIGANDIYFFDTSDEVLRFVEDNVSDFDSFRVVHFHSTNDAIQLIVYGKNAKNILSSQNTSTMNQENLKFLQDRLFYLGTEKRLHPELEKNMNEGKNDFTLLFSNHYNKDRLTANLHFRKSDNSEMYFLNKYDASLQKPGQEAKSQTFYLENGKGVTMKEAYNLLDGRSVNRDLKNKEGEVKNAWIKLDFSNKEPNGNFKQEQFYKNYGFDLQSELTKLPLAPMPSERFTQMVESLQRGNIQEIKLDEKTTGIPESLFINANPKFKSLDMSDENGRPFSREEKSNIYQLTPDQKNAIDEKANENIKVNPDIFPDQKLNSLPLQKEEKKTVVEQKVESKKEKKVSAKAPKKDPVESLLPKKHINQKRGLSL